MNRYGLNRMKNKLLLGAFVIVILAIYGLVKVAIHVGSFRSLQKKT